MFPRNCRSHLLFGISLTLLLIGVACNPVRVRSVDESDSQQPSRCRLSRPRSSQDSPCTEGSKLKRFFLHESNPRGCKRFGICPNDAAQHDSRIGDREENYFLSFNSCQKECMKHIQCPELVVLPESNVHEYSDNNLQGWGRKVVYECNSGYSLPQNTRRYERVCLKNGTWSGKSPVCLEQCQAPLAISHANIAPAKHLHNQGSNVHYACEVGYTLQGNSMRTCGPQGQWIGPDPSCVCSVALMNGTCPICRSPSPIENGHINRTVNAVIDYRCDSGYILVGGSSRSCLGNGNWSGSEPMCWKVTILMGVNEKEDVTNETVSVEMGSKGVVFEAIPTSPDLFEDYEWSFSGTNGKTDLPYALETNGLSLTFSTILKSKEQEGNYTITFGNFSASFTLVAINVTQNTTEGERPEIKQDPTTMSRTLGSSVSFYCISSGKPVPKLTWYHNNQTITTSTTEIPSLDSLTIGILTIDPITSSDVGAYHCSAKNSAGSVSSSVAHLTIRSKRSAERGDTGMASLCSQESADEVTLLGRPRKTASTDQSKSYKVHIKQVLRGSSTMETLRKMKSVRTIMLNDNLLDNREGKLRTNTDYVFQGRLLGKTLVVTGDRVHRYTAALQQHLVSC